MWLYSIWRQEERISLKRREWDSNGPIPQTWHTSFFGTMIHTQWKMERAAGGWQYQYDQLDVGAFFFACAGLNSCQPTGADYVKVHNSHECVQLRCTIGDLAIAPTWSADKSAAMLYVKYGTWPRRSSEDIRSAVHRQATARAFLGVRMEFWFTPDKTFISTLVISRIIDVMVTMNVMVSQYF